MSKTNKGRKRATVPNVSKTPVNNSGTKRRNPLPTHYNFTPAEQIRQPQSPEEPVRVLPQPSTSAGNEVRHYPPPVALFHSSNDQRIEDLSIKNHSTRGDGALESPIHNSNTPSHPSSQGNNFYDDSDLLLPELQVDLARALNALLRVPNLEKFTTVLSPLPQRNITWFTRDKKGHLVRKITKICKNKFDGPYYSWTIVPRDRQERYFLEFAKTHTWDPLITGTVQRHFEHICQRRMKDMISNARTSRKRPPWISESIWKTMVEYWDTDEAKKKSRIYSQTRLSDRSGLGPHIHLSGPTSYQQIQQQMEEELGRPVSLGEVFIKTHTKKDGTYVDRKAEQIVQAYEKNLQKKLAQVEAETSVSDGTSQAPELTTDQYTAIFLQSTQKDSRGNIYGLGSLKFNMEWTLTGTYNQHGESSLFVALQEKLKEAQWKIEEQAAREAAREAEHARVVAEQKSNFQHLSLVEKYLRQTDPAFLDFMAANEPEPSTSLTSSPPV